MVVDAAAEVMVRTRHPTLYISTCPELRFHLCAVTVRTRSRSGVVWLLLLFGGFFFPVYFVQGSILGLYGSFVPLVNVVSVNVAV